ncbi:hypothetical protein AAP_02294 [Ascosphaera apis ARSEF 7405]|uniref:Uncharacterized protein n=1 Tax=Ascosphaera apis ARSEF 7405 TaxID=392613 RepID=A0A168A5V5_9EURO|nr:hypothetical protein AAP_02294 [Ascosphaera apis ARSEF 7405]
MPAATGVHLPRSLTWKSNPKGTEKSTSRLKTGFHSSSHSHSHTQSHAPISSPLPLDTPLPTVPASMQNRQPLSKKAHKSVKRGMISRPIELLSTTNELAYSSPDLKTMGMGMSSDAVIQSAANAAAAAAAAAAANGALPTTNFVSPMSIPPSVPSRSTSQSEGRSYISDTFSTGNGSLDSPLGSPTSMSPIAHVSRKNFSCASSTGSSSGHSNHRAGSIASNHSQHGYHHAHYHTQEFDHSELYDYYQDQTQPEQPESYGMRHSHTFHLADDNPSQSPSVRGPLPSDHSKSASQGSSKSVPTGRSHPSSNECEHERGREHEHQHQQRGYDSHHHSPSSSQNLPGSPTHDHPFYQELAQVKEVAEEFGIGFASSPVSPVHPQIAVHGPAHPPAHTPAHTVAMNPSRHHRSDDDQSDDRFLRSKGLKAFRASEYLNEIEDLHSSPYGSSGLSPYAEEDETRDWF